MKALIGVMPEELIRKRILAIAKVNTSHRSVNRRSGSPQ